MKFKWGILLVVFVAVAGFLVWKWQMKKLSNAIASLPVERSQNLALGALADIALDRSVLGNQGRSSDNEAMLDKYRRDPRVVEEEAQFVQTWLNANSLIKELSPAEIPLGVMVDSTQLNRVSPKFRIDAWNHAFCVFSTESKIVVISGGQKNLLVCGQMRGVAAELARTVVTKKLVKAGSDVFAVVQSKSHDTATDATMPKDPGETSRKRTTVPKVIGFSGV
jgi:hypothetical protein